MNSLVDYGFSSSDSSSDEEPRKSLDENIASFHDHNKLPKPQFGSSSSCENSVFSNPFVEAENAKSAVLETHVKMIPGKDKILAINGKKICWNYRKGRCRFGHNCKFAHDSDLVTVPDDKDNLKQELSNLDNVGAIPNVPACVTVSTEYEKDNIWEDNVNKVKLKRPGLTQGLMPSKKVMKMYKKQKSQV